MSITLIKTKTLKTRLTSLVSDSIDNTVSLAFYTMINGNVSALSGATKSITTSLHPVYRQFVCASFKDDSWIYDKTKATKLLESLGLEFNNTTFEEFTGAVENSLLLKQAIVDDKKAQEEALTPAEIKANHLKRIESYLLAQLKNISTVELATIVAKIKNTSVSPAVPANMKIQAITAS